MSDWIQAHKEIEKHIYRRAVSKLGFTNGTLLDVGCNAGYYSFVALEFDNLVLGIDSDEIAINEANKTRNLLTSEQQIGIIFKQKNIYEYIPDNNFDYIFCNNTIQYLTTDGKNPFEHFSKLIRENGKIFVGCVPDVGVRYTTKSKKKIKRIITKPRMTVMAAEHGFVPIAIYFQFDTHEIEYEGKKYMGLDVLNLSLKLGCDVLYSVLFQKVNE